MSLSVSSSSEAKDLERDTSPKDPIISVGILHHTAVNTTFLRNTMPNFIEATIAQNNYSSLLIHPETGFCFCKIKLFGIITSLYS